MKFLDLSGYMFSGKAAVSDLIAEFSGFSIPNYRMEFDLIRAPHGLSDLKHALVDEWSLIRADAALRNFIKLTLVMGRKSGGLRERLFYPGLDYSSRYSNFNLKTEKFIKDLTDDSWAIKWPYELPSLSPIAYAKLRVLSKLKGSYPWPEINYHLCSGDDFMIMAKNYIEDLLANDPEGSNHTVVTHNMLEPCNPAAGFCFFENIKSIVVDRDVRDIYMTASTYSKGFNDAPSLYSRISGAFNIDTFIKRQRILRNKTNYLNQENILRIKFEDLVLDYNESCLKVYNFLQIQEIDHKLKLRIFEPERSKRNIGLWKNAPSELRSNIKKIEKELPDLCYQ